MDYQKKLTQTLFSKHRMVCQEVYAIISKRMEMIYTRPPPRFPEYTNNTVSKLAVMHTIILHRADDRNH